MSKLIFLNVRQSEICLDPPLIMIWIDNLYVLNKTDKFFIWSDRVFSDHSVLICLFCKFPEFAQTVYLKHPDSQNPFMGTLLMQMTAEF